jgi:hypothetical protein
MKFALLGADAESLALGDAAAAAGHEIVWCGDLAGAQPSDHSWLRGEDRSQQWEDLHDAELCDGILVGRGAADQDLRARQVQELAKHGRPLLCTFPLFESVLTFFEIDLARAEGGGVLHHFNPLVAGGAEEKLAKWVLDGDAEFGPVEQLVATRSLVDRSTQQVLWHFARDVELLCRVAGPLDRIGAHASGGDAANYAALAVQLSGKRPVPVRWTVEPAVGGAALNITLIFQDGRRQVVFDDSPGTDANLETCFAAAISRFARNVQQRNGATTWPSALSAMELADSIEISLRRGRMIDVYQRELTEQLAFKGVMSAVGCGVLVALVPLSLLAGWIAGAFNAPFAGYWPHVLLAILAAFLAFQLLPKLVLGDRRRSSADGRDEAADESPTTPAESNSAD